MLTSATRDLIGRIARTVSPTEPCVVLTGAGISAESGVPTFRGEDGYWRVGSRNYHPQELATYAAFRDRPAAVLGWYLHRWARYRDALPNAAHAALVELDAGLSVGALRLVTQNIDGLHRRAGHAPDRMWCIHGDLELARCADEGCPAAWTPEPWPECWVQAAQRAAGSGTLDDGPRCPRCGDWLRPHVLWFDEYYDEERFHFDSSLSVIERASGLLVVGTSGATNLPTQMVQRALYRSIPTIVIDTEETVFGEAACRRFGDGAWVRGAAGATVPRFATALLDGLRST